jgi:hypothetical protein
MNNGYVGLTVAFFEDVLKIKNNILYSLEDGP